MLYFDTSFLAPLILPEATSDQIAAFLSRLPAGELTVSHWTMVELASLIAREVRMGGLNSRAAERADARFEAMVDASFSVLLPSADDFALAKRYLGRFESGLRAGDALHLAIATNHHAAAIYSPRQDLAEGRESSRPAGKHGDATRVIAAPSIAAQTPLSKRNSNCDKSGVGRPVLPGRLTSGLHLNRGAAQRSVTAEHCKARRGRTGSMASGRPGIPTRAPLGGG